ncbi:hypothetical protein M436DRAFT_61597 [Aureobasidium namibiae CBS 147.97]|uniref:GATA-type domain-containing protein n=1 Tax=Aureobasidium namibiae CBS 147.97 TaxID=1043004 RepID=A0A074WXV9_9PEZI|nr:uncharacterized protein M436DRAFT_61597 [Aureobasidium namibiae CBS 147.97]KEQ76349.1 hypothetical protein M436DRAFT_61597 [Aureobasidium namibiae CBS 147.97]
MTFALSCLALSVRLIALPRPWSRVLAYPYTTSAILYSPSPLKMDAKNVYAREWFRRNPEKHNRAITKWIRENQDKRREIVRASDQKRHVYIRLYKLLINYEWPMQHFTWKTHTPVKTQEAVKRACSSCGRYERQGLRLWWKRRNPKPADADLYDCFACFYTLNPGHVAPIEYESLSLREAVDTMQEARKQHDKSLRQAIASPSDNDKTR